MKLGSSKLFKSSTWLIEWLKWRNWEDPLQWSRKLNELKLSWIKVQKTHWIEVEVLNFSNDSSRGIEKTQRSRKLFEWNTNTRLKLECSHSSWKLQLEDTLFNEEVFIAWLKCQMHIIEGSRDFEVITSKCVLLIGLSEKFKIKVNGLAKWKFDSTKL